MKPPCLMVVGDLLPSLRLKVAKEMVEERGIKPIEVARRMGITPAAVTQYLKGVRGRNGFETIFNDNKIKPIITGLVDQVMTDPVDQAKTIGKVCQLCAVIRKEGMLCNYCKRSSNAGDNICEVCLKPCP